MKLELSGKIFEK